MAESTPGSDLTSRPAGELLKQLSDETMTLIRQEIDLAKAEIIEQTKKAGLGAGMVGAAGFLGIMSFAAVTAGLILAFARRMPAWLGAMTVAALYAAIAGGLARKGKEKVQQATPPVQRTVDTVKEDLEWARNQTPSGEK